MACSCHPGVAIATAHPYGASGLSSKKVRLPRQANMTFSGHFRGIFGVFCAMMDAYAVAGAGGSCGTLLSTGCPGPGGVPRWRRGGGDAVPLWRLCPGHAAR
jgi:hypothetical protein